jgi:mitochondrial distribution and morphology protein 12
MSIDVNWDTLTGGPDGETLAERIRDFIHTKFQAVPLPRFIKSVKVHDFQFGSIPPKVVLKDICDPLADFYEEMPEADELDDSEDDEDDEEYGGGHGMGGRLGDDGVPDAIRTAEKRRRDEQRRRLAGGAGGGGYGYGYGYGGGSRTSSRSTSPRPPQTPELGVSGFPPHIHTAGLRSAPATPDLSSPFRGLAVSAGTPGGVPGGTSNMHYFPSHIATGWSGTQTPLAAFAGGGAHMNLSGWLDSAAAGGRRNGGGSSPSSYYEPPSPSPRAGGSKAGYGYNNNNSHHRDSSQSSVSVQDLSSASGESSRTAPPQQQTAPQQPSLAQGKLAPMQQLLREKHSVSTLAPTSVGTGTSRPPTRDNAEGASGEGGERRKSSDEDSDGQRGGRRKFREPRVEDMQAVFRIRYAGDVHLMLTAEILLDYPMPSFVGIPVKLNISGLSFDGVGVVAYIRRRVHFCFLSPEDAVAAVGADDDDEFDDDDEEDGDAEVGADGQKQKQRRPKGRMGGLLQEIRVESEIGLREGSKQSLKNVGKVERFVLEQVRRIFEEEFVYPSFWTFLV